MEVSVEPERKDQGTLHLPPVLNHSTTLPIPFVFFLDPSIRREINYLHPSSSLSFFVPSSLHIVNASAYRAFFCLESSVGDGRTMKHGDDESEVRREVIVNTNGGGFSFHTVSGFPFSVSI